ncbi:MAG: glutamate--tRNA ligase [Desulfatibacillaceae bacterium]
MPDIRTRFPPSPTGALHVGGARTALFNWLYAKKTGGAFILRIEDTDTVRSTKESVDGILNSLTWLGIDWDEGPFFQMQRMDVYREYVDKLLESGQAYYCTCSQQRLEEMREKAMAAGGKPKYDGTCRDKCLGAAEDAVIRLRSPLTGHTIIDDVVKGRIAINNEELDDLVLFRANGTPTYNFAVVVDDVTMGITHVIRGDDHVSNTPRQILIYEALEAPVPVFGHVPMVLGPDKKRLSKRHGATSVFEYRDMGYLPDALINYLVRLGWSHGDQEFFTREDLVEKFDLTHLGTSAGVFDPEKLLALNAEHIRAADSGDLASLLPYFLEKEGVAAEPDAYTRAVVEQLKPRSKTLVEMAKGAVFYYADDFKYEEKGAKKFLKGNVREPMYTLLEKMEAMAPDRFGDEAALEAMFNEVVDAHGIKLGKIAQPVRVALTGRTASPGIFEMISLLGKDRVVSRVRRALEYIDRRVLENG